MGRRPFAEAIALAALRLSQQGGSVARRLVLRILSLVLALSASAAIRAAEPLRITIDAGNDNVELRAGNVATWEETRERVFLFRDKVAIQAGKHILRADRAAVWIAIEPNPDNAPTRGEIYLEGGVAIGSGANTQQTADSAVVRFSTTGIASIQRKSGIEQKNLADIPFYRNANAARQPGVVTATGNGPKNEPESAPREAKASTPFEGIIQPVQGTTTPKAESGAQGGKKGSEPPLFETPVLPLPPVSTRKLKIGNRSANPTFAKYMNMPNGEQIALITGGIKLLAVFPERGNEILDVESDELVVWQKGGKTSELVEAMRDNEGVTQDNDREVELFLSGNVIMRYGMARDPRLSDGSLIEEKVMRADRVYYDVSRSKAIALDADLEMISTGIAEPGHFRGEELWQLSTQEFQAHRANAAASKLPADPGLNLRIRQVTITEEKDQVRRTIFGMPFIDRYTGEQVVGPSRRYKARNTFVEFGGVPVMWFPYLSGDVNDPTGPLESINYRTDSVFGNQYYTTWSLLELLGIKKLPGESWNLMVDYLSDRGPALGTSYDLKADKLFGIEAPFTTRFLAYGMRDEGFDNLGGQRSYSFVPTAYRGRVLFKHVQEYENLSFQGQLSYMSDRNFIEQYYKYDWDIGPNQETFVYWKYQSGIGAATLLAEPNLNRPWVTETQWLPRVDGFWLGQSFFDRITYNTWASAGYANLKTFSLPTSELPTTIDPTTVPSETPIQAGRFDWMQQASVPFSLGALKIDPYATLGMTYYSNDLNGDSRGRVIGGVGARVSLPFSKLYEGIQSELFNVNGIYHKTKLVGNYYSAWSNTPYTTLAQLDRMNDDATMQSVRDIQPWQPTYVENFAGNMLFNSPLYDPRKYALRRLVDTRVDALDSIQVVQAEFRQRWQTKRGYPGQEHTVDYITLDLSGSYFPAKDRDNFGHQVAFLEYDATWAVGDNNGFTSSGWVDPWAFGTRYWNIAAYFTRPDGASLNLSYRHFEPVDSRLATIAVIYRFSPKYAVGFSASYDLSIANNQSNTLSFSRTGTDMTWSVGFSYNAIISNFGFNFSVIPNLLAQKGAASSNSIFGTANNSVYGRQ